MVSARCFGPCFTGSHCLWYFSNLPFAINEAHRILRSGGVFVIDNFFGGEKVSDPAQRDPKTVALREAGKSLKNQVDLWVTSLIPIGDGLLLATKL
jgi:predicted O-methyltransferase YrrM